MSKRIFITLFLFCLGLLFHENTAAQSSQMHVGYWEMDLDKSFNLMSQLIKNKYDSLPSDVKTRAVASMKGRAFTFTLDSVYVDWKLRGQHKRTKGTWFFTSTESEILIRVEHDEQWFTVTFQEDGDLILENKKPMGYFYRMYLKKIK